MGNTPIGVAVHPDGPTVYVTNGEDNTVSVIDAATNTVNTKIPVGSGPVALGLFIGPIAVQPPPVMYAPVVWK